MGRVARASLATVGLLTALSASVDRRARQSRIGRRPCQNAVMAASLSEWSAGFGELFTVGGEFG
jgi:hypothetical protein